MKCYFLRETAGNVKLARLHPGGEGMSIELVESTQAFLWALPAREGECAAGACAPSLAAAD